MFLDNFNIPDDIVEKLYSTKNVCSEKLICSTIIGYTGRTYRIYVRSELDDTKEVGYTNYQEAKIFIKFLDLNMVHKTLVHELTHAWMFENGHNQSEREFNNEDVCEICANSYDFIYDTLKCFYSNLLQICLKPVSVNRGKHEKEE